MIPNLLRTSVAAFWLIGAVATPAYSDCGDDIVDVEEGCDDGNLADGDGCSSLCVIEPPLGRRCELTFALESMDALGALQFQVDYSGAGQFRGADAAVECTSLVPDTIVFSGNDAPQQSLTLAQISLNAFAGPIDLWRCVFDIQAADGLNPTAADLDIVVQDSSDENGNPVFASVVLGEVTCDGGENCGDGSIQPYETCDDGNTATGDGCDDACVPEPCWACETSIPTTTTLGLELPGPSVCTPVANGTTCTDHDACTDGDTCEEGACLPGEPLVCGNDDACDGVEFCHAQLGCQAGPVPNCDDADACTDDSCDAMTGCSSVPNDQVCCDLTFSLQSTGTLGALQFLTDYSAANGDFDGTGSNSSCVSLIPVALTAALDDDLNSQLLLSAISVSGFSGPVDVFECGFHALDGLRPDESDFVITIEDAGDVDLNPASAAVQLTQVSCNSELCGDGSIQSYEVCDDGNTSAGDGCDENCEQEPCWTCEAALPTTTTLGAELPGPSVCEPVVDGTACTDGSVCTDGDVCAGGECLPGPSLSCGDGNVCNGVEICNPSSGCQGGTPLPCNDADECTDDSCDPLAGCQSVPNGDLCCDITFRLESSGLYGATQFLTDYSDADGDFEGSGPNASCLNLLPGVLLATNDVDALKQLTVGQVDIAGGFSAPTDLVRCGFHSVSGLPPVISDFDITVQDSTDPGGEPLPISLAISQIDCPTYVGCPSVPRLDCLDAGASSLLVKDSASDAKDRLKWKWKKGGAFGFTHISDPTDDGQYSVCLYPDSNDLAAHAALPAGPAWRALSDLAYKYADKSAGSGGVRSLKIKPGFEGQTSIALSAGGVGLPDSLLPTGTSYTVQLHDLTEDRCWGASFVAGVVKGEQYKANAP